jgi:hypothetical protein
MRLNETGEGSKREVEEVGKRQEISENEDMNEKTRDLRGKFCTEHSLTS